MLGLQPRGHRGKAVCTAARRRPRAFWSVPMEFKVRVRVFRELCVASVAVRRG